MSTASGDSELAAGVVSTLVSSPAPVGYAALRKLFVRKNSGVTDDLLKNAVETALNDGRIFRWGDFGPSKQRYWRISRLEYLAGEILRRCGETALVKARISIPGFSKGDVFANVSELVSAGRLRKYPPIGREKERLGASDDAYAAALREFVAGRLKKAGMDSTALFVAEKPLVGGSTDADAGDLAERVLDALRHIEPDPNIPVASVTLRRHLRIGAADKTEFDKIVVGLRDRQRVYLSPHHNPYGLSDEDRSVLIAGGDGTHYSAVTLREVG